MTSFPDYDLQPLLLPAAEAHQNGWVTYEADGTAVVTHELLEKVGHSRTLRLAPRHQFPAIRATFDDLNKALTRLSNSPLLEGGSTLRSLYDEELERYETLVSEALARGDWEPDYGTYVVDHFAERLYLVAPEKWHRLALVTSNSKLTTDPEGQLSWQQIRQKLEGAVIGFAGLSVGSNLLEGWLREARPRAVKIADPDWLELTNFNRCERASLRHLVASRATRFEANNPYESPRQSKLSFVAYEQNLVDPYLRFFAYPDALSLRNLDRFFQGSGQDEPAIDILVDEIDDLDVKVLLREEARQRRIDVLMLTDFGHRTHVLWNPFREHPEATIGASGNDTGLQETLAKLKEGERASLFQFVDHLCQFDYRGDPFEIFAQGKGEQPTASLPQSGTTTQIAGGIGGKELALRILGRKRSNHTSGIAFDFLNHAICRPQVTSLADSRR